MHHPKSLTRWLLGLVVVASLAGVSRSVALAGDPGRRRVVVEPTAFLQVPEPSLEGGVGWINSAPITLKELRGKIVLLDFWTYCCINCHHVLPDLAKLEEKYKDELVVIGVHTAKFYAERDTENIRRKVHEYQIKHPVINDANQVLWNRFNVNSWPTLVLIDANGKYKGFVSGEGNYEVLDKEIGKLVREHRARKELNETPVKFFPENEKPDTSPLSYPGKVLADKDGNRLFIADTGHNRIVMTDLSGKDATVIGNGSAGLANGGYDKAQFNRPQGMCLVDGILYVADTEDHALRAIDLKAKDVSTVAGNGQQSHMRRGAGLGKETGLNSPWDLVLMPGTKTLAIAMAGPHQIWRYDIPTGIVSVWAGTAEENIADGPIERALFAQPSGLATDGNNIFVADSETSSIREISLKKPYVRTIVGQGLFVFDDVDGQGDEVRLQHCLGVAYGEGKLYIADSYNNKIKECDPRSRTVETLVGNRQPGETDDPPRFFQPGGLSLAGSTLYVADTDNNAIRTVDLKSKVVKTLELTSLEPPKPPVRKPTFTNAKVIETPPAHVAPGKSFALAVRIPLNDGDKLNDQAPMPFLIETPGHDDALAGDKVTHRVDRPSPRFTVDVPLARDARPGDSLKVRFSVSAFVCNSGSNLCQIKNFVWNVPVTFSEDGKKEVILSATK